MFSIGDKVNWFTILSEGYHREGKHGKYFLVRCKCGNEKELNVKSFQGNRQTMSCGCSRKGTNSISRSEVEAGQKFGELTIIFKVEPHTKGRTKVVVDCSCGSKGLTMTFDSIKSGKTRSCGCLQKKRASEANTKHGLYKTQIYKHWNRMIQRCKGTSPSFKNYSERGITVCNRWSSDNPDGFLNFKSDMGCVPKGFSLDRINNDLGYFPENCRWTDNGVQMHNKSKLKGKTSEFMGVSFRKDTHKWTAVLWHKGVVVFRGTFDIELEAAIAYDEASYKHYGDKPNELKIKQRLNKDIDNGSSK